MIDFMTKLTQQSGSLYESNMAQELSIVKASLERTHDYPGVLGSVSNDQ